MHHSISQMKHQLDATLCRFYYCRVTLHVSGASTRHQEYLKLVQRPLVHVLSLQVSHHISLLGLFSFCSLTHWGFLYMETGVIIVWYYVTQCCFYFTYDMMLH